VPDATGERLILGAAWGTGFMRAAKRFTKLAVGEYHLPLTAKHNPMVRAYVSGELQTLDDEPTRILPGVQPPIPERLAPLIAKAMGARSGACVPLPCNEHMVGVLVVFSPRNKVSSEERSVLAGLADQAGLAIENAGLFAEISAARERLQTLSRRLVKVQEEEKRHIARELLDEMGQTLTALKIMLEMASASQGAEMRSNLEQAQGLLHQLLASVRELSLELRPAVLDDLGLLPALLWLTDRYSAQTGVRANLTHRGVRGRRFSPDEETAAYRIVQEALTNVARHAGVAEVGVTVGADESALTLEVRDAGSGFDARATLESAASSGLAGIRERVSALGGDLEIDSTPGAGTAVRATLALAAAGEDARSRRHD
jgi:signal transduction histidine kinase